MRLSSPPADDTVLRLDQIGKSFGRAPVLAGLDLTVRRGEFISFIGPSGCGKSTLLRLIAGLSEPTAGRIEVAGLSPAQARPEMFFVFQDPALLPWRRVAANVALPLELRGVAQGPRDRRVAEVLAQVELSGAAEKFPWQLSGGMKMRVSIARALSIAPRILLLDEPFGSLDAMTRDRLNEELLGLQQESGFTAFFVTHSVAEAVFLSTRIVVLAGAPGRIADIVPVPFDGSRTVRLREDPEFLKLLAHTSRVLRGAQTTAP